MPQHGKVGFFLELSRQGQGPPSWEVGRDNNISIMGNGEHGWGLVMCERRVGNHYQETPGKRDAG